MPRRGNRNRRRRNLIDNIYVYLCEECEVIWSSELDEEEVCETCNKVAIPQNKLLYVCDDCHRSWSSNRVDSYGQRCQNCRATVDPELKGDNKMFGKYRCLDCKRHWASGLAYVGYRQKCKSCLIYVEPYFLVKKENPVSYAHNTNDPRKPHESHLCERCILGKKCRIAFAYIANAS